jgi:hypothetical protein
MRALAGPVMLLVVIGGFGLHRALSKPTSPPRDFLELELAGADDHRTGSCYSLSTVLVASTAFMDVTRTWESGSDDAWTLTLESLQNDGRGPVHIYRKYTFQQREKRVHLTHVDASEDLDTGIKGNIDQLLEGPHERKSTPVDRCAAPGATGYQFTPK